MFRTLTIGDVLEDFMDNMSQEQIDEELKLFDRIGRELLGQDKDYTECGVVIDEDHMVDKDLLTVSHPSWDTGHGVKITGHPDSHSYTSKSAGCRAGSGIYCRLCERTGG